MPPPEGGVETSDLHPLTAKIASAASTVGLNQLFSDSARWLIFMVLPSRSEVWRRSQSRRNY